MIYKQENDHFYAFTILPGKKLIIVYVEGNLTLKEVIQFTFGLFHHKDYNPEYDVIVDFRNALTIGFRIDVPDYISFLRKTFQFNKKVRVSLIYQTLNQKFLFTLYKSAAKILNLNVELFKNPDSCYQWMNFSQETADLVSATLFQLHAENLNPVNVEQGEKANFSISPGQ